MLQNVLLLLVGEVRQGKGSQPLTESLGWFRDCREPPKGYDLRFHSRCFGCGLAAAGSFGGAVPVPAPARPDKYKLKGSVALSEECIATGYCLATSNSCLSDLTGICVVCLNL